MIEALQSITVLKAAIDMAKAAIAVRDDQKIRDALNEAISSCTDLTIKVSDLASKLYESESTIRDLKKQVHELEEKLEEKIKYELFEVVSGRFCYKRVEDSGQPSHYLCQACYDKGVRSILRDHRKSGGMGLECIENNSHFIWAESAMR